MLINTYEQPSYLCSVMKKPIEPEEGDYYTENGYRVFTEKYHLKRGYCCQSGCRHCPYGFDKNRPPL
jgi:hypothetical protein